MKSDFDLLVRSAKDDLLCELERLEARIWQALGRSVGLNIEDRRVTLASGSVLVVNVNACPVESGDGLPPVMLLAFEDITRRRRSDQERAALVQGHCAIKSAPGEGTSISVELPISPEIGPTEKNHDQDNSSRGPQPGPARPQVPA